MGLHAKLVLQQLGVQGLGFERQPLEHGYT
jgi:hypothetical protein